MAKKLKPESYSVTKLDMAEACNWAFKKVHREKIPRAEHPARNLGIQAHELSGLYMKHLIFKNLQTDIQHGMAYLENYQPQEAPEMHPELEALWQGFVETYVRPLTMANPGVEERLAFDDGWEPTPYFEEKARFRMVLDLTFTQDDLLVVQDWKTGFMVKDISKDLQTRAYAWGKWRTLENRKEIKRVLVRHYYMRWQTTRELVFEVGELDFIPEYLDQKIINLQAIDENQFKPTPGTFCGICGVMAHCPAMKQALVPQVVVPPATRKEAEDLASLLLRLDKVSGELRKMLKVFVADYGPVKAGNMVYGPNVKERWYLPPEAVTLELLKTFPREEVWGLVTVSKTELEKFLKRRKQAALLDNCLALGGCQSYEELKFLKKEEEPLPSKEKNNS